MPVQARLKGHRAQCCVRLGYRGADGLADYSDATQLLFRTLQHKMLMSGGTTDQQTSTCRSPAHGVRNDELVKDGGLDDRPVDFALLRNP